MKLFKKLAMCVMSAVLSVSVLGACGGGSKALKAYDSEGNRTVKMMVHVSEKSVEGIAYKKRVDAFNEAYRDQKIKASIEFKARSTGATGYETELTNLMRAGRMPDIITFDAPNAWNYAGTYLAPIDEYISQETVNDIPEVSRNYGEDGKLYGLPIQESSAGIYYNAALLKAAGVYDEVQQYTVDNPWTFEQFKAVCDKIKKSNVVPNGFAVDMRLKATGDETATYLLYPFVMATGGQMLSDNGRTAQGYLNSEASVKGFEFLRELVDAGYTSYAIDDDGFFTGKNAMYLSSGWTIPDIKTKYQKTFPTDDSWGILPYPRDVHAVSPTASWSFGMANVDRGEKESVIKLLEWMVTPASSIAITNATGMIPARTTAVQSKNYKAGSPEEVLYRQLVTSGKKRPNTQAYATFSRAFANVILGIKNIKNSSGVRGVVNDRTNALQVSLDEFFA